MRFRPSVSRRLTPINALISILGAQRQESKKLYLFETLLLLQGTSGEYEHENENDRVNLASHFSKQFLFLVVSRDYLSVVRC